MLCARRFMANSEIGSRAWPGLAWIFSRTVLCLADSGWRQDYVVTFCQSTVAIQLDLNAVNTAALITNNNNSHETATTATRAAAV